MPPSRTKNLNHAHQLASEQHPLSHWKKVLHDFQESVEQKIEDDKLRKIEKEEKEKKKAAAKQAKAVAEGNVADEDDDAALDGGEGEPKKKKSNKKRELAEGEGKTGVSDYENIFPSLSTNYLPVAGGQENQVEHFLQVSQRYARFVCKAKEGGCIKVKESLEGERRCRRASSKSPRA